VRVVAYKQLTGAAYIYYSLLDESQRFVKSDAIHKSQCTASIEYDAFSVKLLAIFLCVVQSTGKYWYYSDTYVQVQSKIRVERAYT
jgi:hypothetical protein